MKNHYKKVYFLTGQFCNINVNIRYGNPMGKLNSKISIREGNKRQWKKNETG